MPGATLLCSREQVTDVLLAQYLDACEAQNPGLTERTLVAVSEEITDCLAYRYPQPWPCVPPLIRHIAQVFVAYRVVQAITSLVQSEAGSNNEWIPLQQEWKHCTQMLEDLVSARRSLALPENPGQREDPHIAVVSPQAVLSPLFPHLNRRL